MTQATSLGKIEISPNVVVSIVHHAVSRSYGVVGLASRHIADELVGALQPGARGVQVHVHDDRIAIDVYVIIEYGTRISSVAHSLMNVVKYSVERALDIPVEYVNVHVQGLRVSSPD